MTAPVRPSPLDRGRDHRCRRDENTGWDPLRWYPDTLIRHARDWLAERPWHRRTLWILGILFFFVVFPGMVGLVIATAQVSSGVSQIDGLGWMNITDSNGVPLSSYMFASNKGNILNPGYTVLWTLLGLEFVGYMAIVTTAIWIVGFTFSFVWLDYFADALNGTATALSRQIATPMMLITAATIGAFFVAWFIVRGFPSKATMQVITMLGVAIFGPMFLADPLHDVLSSDGLLTQGRDVGITVAAGLTGDGNPNPVLLVKTMQEDLADNFARKPVQVWNFGQVVDNYGSCESAWSSGVLSGKDSNVLEAIKQCGDGYAYSRADNPSMGQVGTGIILLICATLLLAFAVYLALKVMKAAMNTIYHGFMAIFGFAAGGFVYGPTQTFLVRNLVDALIATARMTVFTIFLGIYVLFMSNLFDQARGQVMSVIVIACVVEVVAISQVRRLNSSLSRGNDWVANRFSAAIQGQRAGAGGGGGGSAIGMGGAGGGGSLTGMAALGALNTVNSSPVAAWLMMATPNPFSPLSRGKKRSDLTNIRSADWRLEGHEWGQMSRTNWVLKAHSRADSVGGMLTAAGVANAIDGLGDSRVPDGQMNAALLAAGSNDDLVHHGLRAASAQKASMSTNPYGFAPLQKALAAGRAIENHLRPTDPQMARNAFASQLVVASDNFSRHTSAPPAGAQVNQGFVNRVRQHWDSDIALQQAITPDEWNAVGRGTRWTIANEVATSFRQSAHAYQAAPNEMNRRNVIQWSNRLANLDHLDPTGGLDPWDP